MLLRQLYLALFERGHFRPAYLMALQATDLGVLEDVVHQDAARAAFAFGDADEAVRQQKLAVLKSPDERRAFHLWSLGSTLFVSRRHDEAADALRSAASLARAERPLYRAHLLLARHASGKRVRGLESAISDLADAPCGQGYGRFVLGHLCVAAGFLDDAHCYLEAFVRRTTRAGSALVLALRAELEMSERVLRELRQH